jgi:hypothetical protein
MAIWLVGVCRCCKAACDFNNAFCSCEQSVLDFAATVGNLRSKAWLLPTRLQAAGHCPVFLLAVCRTAWLEAPWDQLSYHGFAFAVRFAP